MPDQVWKAAEPADELEIRNRLALYAIAIDTKAFTRLSEVFDSSASFASPRGLQKGVDNIIDFVTTTLGPVNTQHALSTILVEQATETSVKSTTYLTATIFEKEDPGKTRMVLYSYYEDEWIKGDGGWRIRSRAFRKFGA